MPIIAIEVKNSPIEALELQLNPKVAKVLGFGEKINFDGGTTYRSSERANRELFNELIIDEEDLSVSLIRRDERLIELSEPEETGIDSLIDDVVTQLGKSGFHVDMALDPNNYLIVRPNYTLYEFTFRLPRAINRAIGVPDDFVFFNDQDIYIEQSPTESSTTEIPKSEKKRSEILKSVNSGQLVLECSILEESNFSPYARKVLRTFKRTEGIRKVHHFEFNPVEYRKVNTDLLHEIRLSISNPQFQIIPETLYPTTVTLHFRPFFLL
jgi:hypothetical protein